MVTNLNNLSSGAMPSILPGASAGSGSKKLLDLGAQNSGSSAPPADVLSLTSTLLQLVLGALGASSNSPGQNAGNAGGAQPLASGSLAPSPPPQAAAPGNRPPRIAQIDDFTADNTGFNHGAEVAKNLNPDGSTDLLQMNIGGSGDRLTKISNSLDNVIARVQKGETIDAVNLSQQDFTNGPQAAQIRAKIDQLAALGVPVAVAAGNNGPNQHNALVSNKAFAVESATNGKVNADSGVGNVQAEGRTTSFATANFALQLAQKHAAGLNVTA